MEMRSKLQGITNLDIVTLQHFAEAQHHDAPIPPAFTDTLFRLAQRGFIKAGQKRTFMVTPKGENFLKGTHKTAQQSHAA